MQKHLIALVIGSLSLNLMASASPVTPPPFKLGEKLSYVLKWKMPAAFLTTEVTALDLENGKVEFKATATSTKFVDKFYPIRYTVLSSYDLNQNGSTHFELRGREKQEYKDQIEAFDYSKSLGTMSFKVDKKSKGKDGKEKLENKKSKNLEYQLTTRVEDILSLLYSVRTAKLPTVVGGKSVFNVAYEGEIWTATLIYLGNDTTKINGIKYSSGMYKLINVSPKGETNANTTFWLAEDAARTLTRVESEVEVGKIVLKLRDSSGPDAEEVELE